MYNRYTPQSDGSYRRDKMPDHSPPSKPAAPPDYPLRQPEEPPCSSPTPAAYSPPQNGITGFLRQLLPANFDTGDLLIILLLLLMAGDSEEEKSNALLTLAFYLFM